MTSPPAATAFRPVVESSEFEHWRSSLQAVMGECRVNCAGLDRQVFQASIQMASAGPLTLVELRGEGAELDLWRQQSSEMAVLWIPERGWTCDRQGDRGDDMITSTGQGLWIAPGADLQGRISATSVGVSILVPRQMLAGFGDGLSGTAVLDPFRRDRQPATMALLRQARELIAVARWYSQWLDHSAGLFWQALLSHGQTLGCRPDIDPAPDVLTDRFLELVRHKLQRNPQTPFALGGLALELHCSARTLQNHLRSELDATPREVWAAVAGQVSPNGPVSGVAAPAEAG